QSDTLLRARSFFGVLRVDDLTDSYRLMHGTTTHGTQKVLTVRDVLPYLATIGPDEGPLQLAAVDSIWREERREPRSYYHRDGPVGRIFAAVQSRTPKPDLAYIGLGAGSLASYGQHGQRVTFYEIDSTVVRIARESGYFTYWADAVAHG